MRSNPHLYEINALTFINRLSAKYGRPISLGKVPDAEWQMVAHLGFDYVWMMGVWQRSPASRRLAISSPGLRREYDRILPDWTENNIAGSPYAIYSYSLDPALGKPDELALLKTHLNKFGIGLILDFVPNHLAADHPWTLTHPEYFVQGDPENVKLHPDWFFRAKDIHLAHGRDPYYAAWDDTAQVDFFSKDLRQVLISVMDEISKVADGVRCDMAMLALNGVFEWVWGGLGKRQRLETEFWAEGIGRIRTKRPDFLFMAEVYWELDEKLRELGFDFTYDKPLYDHLRWDPAFEIDQHIREERDNISRQLHFLENHDEPRVCELFGRERSMAAAVVLATLPGMRFYQDGQLEGRRTRVPVQMAMEPSEKGDADIAAMYTRLLNTTNQEIFHGGDWNVAQVAQGWEGNESHRNILAWKWSLGDRHEITAINYSPDRSQAWLKLNLTAGSSEQLIMRDVLSDAVYVRGAKELLSKGLYVDLEPYHAHIMDLSTA